MVLDVRHLHRDVLKEHWQAWIPLGYALLAMVASALAISKVKARGGLGAFFAAGILVGAFGSTLHSDGDLSKFVGGVLGSPPQSRIEEADEEEAESVEKGTDSAPPVLAPLGLSGLSAFALAAVLTRKEESNG